MTRRNEDLLLFSQFVCEGVVNEPRCIIVFVKVFGYEIAYYDVAPKYSPLSSIGRNVFLSHIYKFGLMSIYGSTQY